MYSSAFNKSKGIEIIATYLQTAHDTYIHSRASCSIQVYIYTYVCIFIVSRHERVTLKYMAN